MTRNQVDALRNIETQRHNAEQEKIDRILIPAQYLSSIGSLLKGASGFMKVKSSDGKELKPTHQRFKPSGGKWVTSATHQRPMAWTIY